MRVLPSPASLKSFPLNGFDAKAGQQIGARMTFLAHVRFSDHVLWVVRSFYLALP